MGFKSHLPSIFVPAARAKTPDASIDEEGMASHSQQAHDSFAASPLQSSSGSTSSNYKVADADSYSSGKFSGRGFFNPANNAQYNFLISKIKFREELRAEQATEMMEMPSRRRASSNASGMSRRRNHIVSTD